MFNSLIKAFQFVFTVWPFDCFGNYTADNNEWDFKWYALH